MKQAWFLMMLSCLAVSTIAAQGPVRHDSKQYKVAEVDDPVSISADGRFLYYEDDVGGDDHFFARDLTTGEHRQLSFGPGEAGISAIVSPDGNQIAYDWLPPAVGADRIWELRVMRADGSHVRILCRDTGIFRIALHAWSLDGKQVLAALVRKDRTYQIVLVQVSDGSVRVLRTRSLKTLVSGYLWSARINFSSDGRFVAYEVQSQQGIPQWDIFVFLTNGGQEVPLVVHPADDRLLGWTPDGKRVLFASNRLGKWDIFVVPVRDGQPRGSPQLVKSNIGPIERSLGFTHDGSYFYGVSQWNGDVYVAAFDSSRTRLRTPMKVAEHVGYDTSLDWSHDGRLAYAWGSGESFHPFLLGIRSSDGSERRLQLKSLVRFGGHTFEPHWSPDGRFLVAQGRESGHAGPASDSQGLYRIDVRTGKSAPIVRTTTTCPYDCVEWPAWSRDGRLVFARWIEWPQRIVVRDVRSGAERELYRSTSPAFVSHLAVSPDGQHVAFLWYDRPAGYASIRVVSIAGGDTRELVKLPALADYWLPLFALGWDSDSRHVIYSPSSAEPGRKLEFWRTSLGGGEPQNLDLSLDGVLPFGLSVHPDGRRIAFVAGTPPRSEVWVLENLLSSPRNRVRE